MGLSDDVVYNLDMEGCFRAILNAANTAFEVVQARGKYF
jgi:hypothetical protein